MLNRVQIIGRLGQDPEIKQTNGGLTVARLNVATSEKWTDKTSGEVKEATEWHRVVIYGKLAEIVQKYTQKGSLLFLEGKLKTRSWEDEQTKQKKYSTDIIADTMKVMNGWKDASSSSSSFSGGSGPQFDSNEDIPF